MKEYIYFWYHHMFVGIEERQHINEYIQAHDFAAFLQFYNWYQINPLNNSEGFTYFPDSICVFEDHELIERISVFDKKNFQKITYSECECG